MNRKQRKELEDKVRQLTVPPYEPTKEHIEEIKRRAYNEFLKRKGRKRSFHDNNQRKI